MLILPNGSRSLIPTEWTDLGASQQTAPASANLNLHLGSVGDLLHARAVVDALLQEGEVRFHPDEAVTSCIRTVLAKFTELGSARQVWLWFRSENLSFPQYPLGMVPTLANCQQLRWVTPTYIAIDNVLRNPVYAGAYVYGKTRNECYVDED